MKIPVDEFAEFFLTICSENSHVDWAKKLLIDILEELEANRSHIYADFEPANGIHAIVNANGLFLIIDYLKNKLHVDTK